MFNKFKTRKGRLEHNIREELEREYPKVDRIISAVESYQKDNINTIEKLKKDKKVDMSKINGALKQTINAHGPITKQLIGSAGKRVYGSLIVNPNDKEKTPRFSLRDIVIGLVVGIITTLILIAVL